MNWKQTLITALVTLFITIVSGIIIDLYQKHTKKVSNEILVYKTEKISEFKSKKNDLKIFKIDVSNVGNKKAENIDIEINFSNNSKVMDITGSMKRTNKTYDHKINTEDNNIKFKIDELFPQDNFSINIVFENLVGSPTLIIESDKTIATKKQQEIKTETTGMFNRSIETIFLTLIILFPIFLIIKNRNTNSLKNRNNTAFLAIHNKLYEIAEELLLDEIKQKGASAIELANYGLLKFITDKNKEKYKKIIRMAEYISETKREKLVISFNKIIIFSQKNDQGNLKIEFKNAINLEKETFKKWLSYSQLISEEKKANPEFKKLIDEFLNNKR